MNRISTYGLSLGDNDPAPLSPAELYARLNTLSVDAAALSHLLLHTSQARVADALRTQEHITQRKLFLQHAADVVAPRAVFALTHAAGIAFDKPVSGPLDSLLVKLTREAETLPDAERHHASQALRSLAKKIVDAWSSNSLDLGASDFHSLFETEYDPLESRSGSAAPEPERVLQMAFETGALGKTVWTAVTALGEHAGTEAMLRMLKRVPSGNRAADAVGQQLASPMRVTLLLQEEPIDFALLDALLPRMGDAAPAVLLDNIIESRNPDVRRGLLNRIAQFGPQVVPLVVERLKRDERWYVQRNMLAILRDLNAPATAITIEKYLTHSDPRVRREAMQLQFQDPAQRARALMIALKENDYQTLKLALQAMRQNLPEVTVPILAKRVIDPQFPNDFRPIALQLLARTRSAFALDALLGFVAAGTSLLGKPKLAAKSPEMLIALSGVARNFSRDRRVQPLLAVARAAKDRDVVAAANRTATDASES